MADSFGSYPGGKDRRVTSLPQQRSMLVILIAACKTAQTAFQAAHNAVDAELLSQLDQMIARSELELEALNRRIEQSAT